MRGKNAQVDSLFRPVINFVNHLLLESQIR